MADEMISEQDVASFQEHLATWAATLPDHEQAILAMIAVRAFPPDDAEVQGFGGGVFEISDFSFDIEQTLNIGSQSSGAGAGKIKFNPFQITRNATPGIDGLHLFVGMPFKR
jgi:hypothetical protein